MKKIIPVFMLLILAAFISVACKSTPPDAPQPASVSVSTESLKEPMAKAEAARQRAIDFESPAYFPSEWETLEAQYKAIGTMPKTNAEEVKEAAETYSNAADAYDLIFSKTIPLYAQAREDEIMSKRDELISTGFTKHFPDYLKNADDITLKALEQYEAEDYYGARDTAAKALGEYEILLTGANVYLARQEITDRDFAKYDEENFLKADEVATDALKEFDAGNRNAAVEKAEEALLRYNLVLSKGWTAYAAEKRQTALEERELALADRANIASREIWREAEALYNQAEKSFAQEKFNDAGLAYIDAVKTESDVVDTDRSLVADNIGHIVKRILDDCPVGSLFVIGGDTLAGIMEQLGINEIIPAFELSPGVASSIISSSNYSFNLITKSGGFGQKDAVVNVLSKLIGYV